MEMRIFISSEMDTKADISRRQAAIDTIHEMGHIPVYFERFPGRALPDGRDLIEYCQEKVSNSDLFIMIVDDMVSDPMVAEHDASLQELGPQKMFYYFTKSGHRDDIAEQIWDIATEGYIVKEIRTPKELQQEIRRSIGSYLSDAFNHQREGPEILYEDTVDLSTGDEFHERFDLEAGDEIIISCLGNDNFFAGLFDREEYVERGSGDIFDFPIGSDRHKWTDSMTIPEDDEYYLVLRRTLWGFSGVSVDVRIRRR